MKTRIAILAILGALLIGGCDPSPTATPKIEIPPPLRLSPPELVTLPVLNQTFSNQRIQVTEDIRGALFQNCTLEVWRENGITITDSMFMNSRMYIEESQNIEISNSVIRDFYVWEDPAISIHASEHILIGHNEIKNNANPPWQEDFPQLLKRTPASLLLPGSTTLFSVIQKRTGSLKKAHA